MKIKHALAALAISFSTYSCNTPEGHEWNPEAGLQLTMLSSYDYKFSALGYTESGDADYSSTDIRIGGTRTSSGESRPIKHEHAGIIIGSTRYAGGLDGVEISGGGRYYRDTGNDLIPYFSFYSTIADVDYGPLGLSTTPQLGVRFGGGFEYLIAEGIVFDIGADYLLPLSSGAVSGGSSSIDLELSGLALRFGVSAGF